MKHIKLFEEYKEPEGNIEISKADFDNLDFDSKKSMLIDTYPSLEFDDMTEDEFDEYFKIIESDEDDFKQVGPEVQFATEAKTYTGKIMKMKYGNGRIALEMVGTKGNYKGEPILVASVNIPEEKIERDEVIIKNYSENEGILDVLVKAKIISKPLRSASVGNTWVCKMLM